MTDREQLEQFKRRATAAQTITDPDRRAAELRECEAEAARLDARGRELDRFEQFFEGATRMR